MTAKELVQLMNEDEYLLEAFRSNPLKVLERFELTTLEAMNLMGELHGLKQRSLRDLQAMTKVLQFLAANKGGA